MSTSIHDRLNQAIKRHSIKAAVVAGMSVFLAVFPVPLAHAATATPSSGPASNAGPQTVVSQMPVFKVIEGAKGSPYPYTPRVLDIPAGKKVALEITDNIGGCQLVTVFPGLGVNGNTVRARVPVGDTRRIVIRAAKPGTYRYHCSENMYFGEIVAE